MSWSRKTMILSDTDNKSGVVVLISLFEIAKPTPASFVSPPLQYIVWSFSMTFPVPSRLTSLRAQISIFADTSSLEMIAVALSGRWELTLSLVVRTFQAARWSRCLLLGYGFRLFSTTTVRRGASVYSDAVTSFESILSLLIIFVSKAAPKMTTALGARVLSLGRKHSKSAAKRSWDGCEGDLLHLCHKRCRVDKLKCRWVPERMPSWQNRLLIDARDDAMLIIITAKCRTLTRGAKGVLTQAQLCTPRLVEGRRRHTSPF